MSRIITLLSALALLSVSFAQNIGVNTTGAAPAAINLFEVLQPSTTENSVGIYVKHSGADATKTLYGFQSIRDGLGLVNVAAYLQAINGTSNYALIVPSGGGNVGIGTSTPDRLLDVHGDMEIGNAGKLYIKSAGGTQTIIVNNGNGNSSAGSDILFNAAGLISAEDAMIFTIDADNGSTTSFYDFAKDTESNAGTSLMRIQEDGNVGIGTTTPIYKLQIGGGVGSEDATNVLVFGKTDAATAESNLPRIHQMDANVMGDANSDLAIGAASSGGSIAFFTGNATGLLGSASSTAKMVISIGGNVGIGTTSPIKTLHITDGAAVTTPPMFRIQALTEASTDPGDVYAGIELGVVGGENSSGSQEVTAYIKAVDTRAGTTSNEDGGLAFGTLTQSEASASTKMTLTHDGNLGIATTSPTHKLQVIGTAGLSTGTAWTNTSDVRLKDIRGNYEKGLAEIVELNTIRFNYKKNNPLGLPSDKEIVGFIAQEVQQQIPEAVITRKDGYLELNVDPIHWASINAIKELNEKIKELEKENNQLKTQNAQLLKNDEALKTDIESIKLILNQQTKK